MGWDPPGCGIKLLNDINHRHGTWTAAAVRYSDSPVRIALQIEEIMNLQEEVPAQGPEMNL